VARHAQRNLMWWLWILRGRHAQVKSHMVGGEARSQEAAKKGEESAGWRREGEGD